MSGTEATLEMHLDDARCADLVLRLLPDDERAAALSHAAVCAECEARLRAHVSAAERARADSPVRSAAPVAGSVGRWPRRRIVTWAAAAALVIAVALPLMRSRLPAHEPAFSLPVPGEEVRTRAGESEDPHLTAGLEAYRAHDLATADRELSAARATGAPDALRRLYLADVRLALNDAPGALELLRGIRWTAIPEPWRRDGVGLLVRALRRTGQSASADSIERAVRALGPGTPFIP